MIDDTTDKILCTLKKYEHDNGIKWFHFLPSFASNLIFTERKKRWKIDRVQYEISYIPDFSVFNTLFYTENSQFSYHAQCNQNFFHLSLFFSLNPHIFRLNF